MTKNRIIYADNQAAIIRGKYDPKDFPATSVSIW